MYKICLTLLFLSFGRTTYGQQLAIDSLKRIVSQQKRDTNEVKALSFLYGLINYSNLDSAIQYAQQGLLLAKSLGYEGGEAICYLQLANGYNHRGDYRQSIDFVYKALAIYERLENIDGITTAHLDFEVVYKAAGDYKSSLVHAYTVKRAIEANGFDTASWSVQGMRWKPLILAEIGDTYERMNRLDSATNYIQKAIKENQYINGAKWNFPFHVLGRLLMKQEKHAAALAVFHSAIPLAIQNDYPKDTLDIYNSIALLFSSKQNFDSAIHYAKTIVDKGEMVSHIQILFQATTTLAQAYKQKGRIDSALKFVEYSNALRDSIYDQEKQRAFQNITFNAQLRQLELQQQQAQNRNKVRFLVLLFSLVFIGCIASILYRSNRNKRRANRLLQNQKEEIEEQKARAELALIELKATQSQLIQREKMASLGELTAGIAHEIQNPLNFVNNFSAVNRELLTEAKQELSEGKYPEVSDLLSTIEQNEEKITHHGKRADSIVKGMLQHAGTGTGEKQPTNINHLVDEYLRLAYQGMRAKHKEFTAAIETTFDDSISAINIVPQDIGRVLLNLFNNAFYAVQQKKKLQSNLHYVPCVQVSTKTAGDHIIITVGDNGTGMPSKISEKVFQPFFTTKPTGEGTGLGLSLSYDIITKGHGGSLTVQSTESEGTEFEVVLPVT